MRVPHLLLGLFLLVTPCAARAGFIAVSLDQVEKSVRADKHDATAFNLGGINRILGIVVDPSGDIVLIGRRDPGAPPMTVEHLAAAIRAPVPPVVSLEGMSESSQTLQVRFEGGVENTRFGNDILNADVELKRLAFGLASAKLWGVPSFLSLSAKAAVPRPADIRFWFTPRDHARLVKRDGVFYIRRLEVAVRTEPLNGAATTPEAERFAATLQTEFQDVAADNAVLARVKPLFDIVAVAAAMREAKPADALSFWLHDYALPLVSTPPTYGVLSNRETARGGQVLEVRGGIDLKVLYAGIEAGDSTALRRAVLSSRPSVDSLVWPVPLAAWPVDGPPARADEDQRTAEAALARKPGTTVHLRVLDSPIASSSFSGGRTGGGGASGTFPRTEPPARPASLSFSLPQWQPPARASQPPSVGGVYFSAVAKPEAGTARLGATGGGFSLMIDQEDAALPADRFARFVTAAWAVYLSKTPPGISIDPIGQGLPKHLVRYIGDVMNSDLGRVMREADYMMKQLAVGSRRLNLPEFRDVDTLSGLHGLTYASASRRFWFVPEDLRFRASNGMLRFDGGRMTLKTEYRFPADKRGKAEPADIAFTKFFNTNYHKISAELPIFADLMDYARMVGLAAYMKQQGVPLLWFLLAHRDFLLTEDSPGTVDAIVRQSKVFEGVRIEGGVDMTPQGHYLPDAEVLRLMQMAARQMRVAPDGQQTDPPPSPVNVGLLAVGRQSYVIQPQASDAAGRDGGGRRYQTDIVLRKANTEPGLELVRYFDPARRDASAPFGNGWNLLLPYRVELGGDDFTPFRNGRIRTHMRVVDLLSGTAEELTFSEDRYAIAGWVPDDPTKSRLIGLFPLTDGSFRLADKIGAEFAFDPAGHITRMVLSDEYVVDVDWTDKLQASDFVREPVRLEPDGTETTIWRNARLPTRVKVTTPSGAETLILRTDVPVLAYAREDDVKPERFVAIMSDGSFRLREPGLGEMVMDGAGHFERLLTDKSLVVGLRQGDQKIGFRFDIGRLAQLLIAEAATPSDPNHVVAYRHEEDGHLMLANNVARNGTQEK